MEWICELKLVAENWLFSSFASIWVLSAQCSTQYVGLELFEYIVNWFCSNCCNERPHHHTKRYRLKQKPRVFHVTNLLFHLLNLYSFRPTFVHSRPIQLTNGHRAYIQKWKMNRKKRVFNILKPTFAMNSWIERLLFSKNGM